MQTDETSGNADEHVCDLCSHHSFETVGSLDRRGRPLETVICTNCGLVSHATLPSEEYLRTRFSGEANQLSAWNTPAGCRRIMRAWQNAIRIRGQISLLLPQGGRLLDVGTGYGCAPKVFQKAGFQAEGIDPCSSLMSFSRDLLKASVTDRWLSEMPAQRTYDVVLLIHVLQYLRSPSQTFQQISSLLHPGGMLYIECPNLQAPFARRTRLFHREHIHSFVPSTLIMLAQQSGFTLRRRFGDDQDNSLQMLFQYSTIKSTHVYSESYPAAMEALGKAGLLPYHLRWRYLFNRFRKLQRFTTERIASGRFVRQLIEECHSDDNCCSPLPGPSRTRPLV